MVQDEIVNWHGYLPHSSCASITEHWSIGGYALLQTLAKQRTARLALLLLSPMDCMSACPRLRRCAAGALLSEGISLLARILAEPLTAAPCIIGAGTIRCVSAGSASARSEWHGQTWWAGPTIYGPPRTLRAPIRPSLGALRLRVEQRRPGCKTRTALFWTCKGDKPALRHLFP